MAKSGERTKVVVRRLPPHLKEEDFKSEVEKVASGTYSWFQFYQGKISTKRVTYSRGYLNFNEGKGALDFKSRFDGFVFVGERGAQYKCSIEYAPSQRIPKRKGRKDHRQGTLESDPDYLEFMKNLDKEPVMLPSAQRQYEEDQAQRAACGEGDDTIVVTPLMEFIVNKHLRKATARANAKDRRGDRRKDTKSKSPSHGRAGGRMKTPPMVLLKTRPPSKGSNSSDTAEKKHEGTKGRSRKPPRVREGHEAWVPSVMRTKVSALDASRDKLSASTDASEVPPSEKSEDTTKSIDGESHSGSGRGRGRRHRREKKGPPTPKPSSSSKVVWIRKAEKPEKQEGNE